MLTLIQGETHSWVNHHAITRYVTPKCSLNPTLKSELFNDFKTIPYDKITSDFTFTIPHHIGLFYYYHFHMAGVSRPGPNRYLHDEIHDYDLESVRIMHSNKYKYAYM